MKDDPSYREAPAFSSAFSSAFASVEPEFRHLVPKAIGLLDRCRREEVAPDKILPVRASLASVEVDDGPKYTPR